MTTPARLPLPSSLSFLLCVLGSPRSVLLCSRRNDCKLVLIIAFIDNVIVNQVFGVASGLGLSFITFDWAQIAFLGSPLVTPWWAEVNIFIGFVVAFCIFSPAMYYTNVSYPVYTLPVWSFRC